ncbi:HAD-IC family P-type ATPase [Sorangium sp. So ce834]|uniref:HAD-IC family P-type ATPase n=1 Tax=Sorangium sp. So ce834 TaxID=3133321 RepID=UPI003F5EE478
MLLWLGAGLAFAAGAPELGFAIVAVVVLNGVFAFVQEHRAEQVVSSLMRRVAVRARVARAGVERRVPARELVPGDVVRLAAGEIVPADCILLGADSLSIDLSMLTGETAPVARSVAAAVGLDTADRLAEGPAIDAMDDRALLELLQAGATLARTTPEQKLRVVQVLRRAGEVVVVTGDGVNDAPALRAADVGVAMGLRGTEVAKQAADIILSDDNFATIVAAIEEGRAIKQNIRRFVSYVFTSNVAELVPFLLYIFLPIPLPLAIVQVLAIDLGTDVLPALALGVEPPSPATLHVPPEPPRRPILTRELGLRTFFLYGTVEALLGVIAYFSFHWAHGWRPFGSLEPFRALEREAATMTFVGIVSGQIGCLIAQRDGPLRKRLAFWSNPWVAAGLSTEVALAIALLYVPGLNGLFAMAPVGPAWLLWLPGGAAAMVLADALRRAVLDRGAGRGARRREMDRGRSVG